VRELENAVGQARMTSLSGTIDVRDLPGYLRDPAETEGLPGL
jgi:hypothetical protein